MASLPPSVEAYKRRLATAASALESALTRFDAQALKLERQAAVSGVSGPTRIASKLAPAQRTAKRAGVDAMIDALVAEGANAEVLRAAARLSEDGAGDAVNQSGGEVAARIGPATAGAVCGVAFGWTALTPTLDPIATGSALVGLLEPLGVATGAALGVLGAAWRPRVGPPGWVKAIVDSKPTRAIVAWWAARGVMRGLVVIATVLVAALLGLMGQAVFSAKTADALISAYALAGLVLIRLYWPRPAQARASGAERERALLALRAELTSAARLLAYAASASGSERAPSDPDAGRAEAALSQIVAILDARRGREPPARVLELIAKRLGLAEPSEAEAAEAGFVWTSERGKAYEPLGQVEEGDWVLVFEPPLYRRSATGDPILVRPGQVTRGAPQETEA
ncbi:MAG: hypothetical protein ACFB2Z_02000 [Maricaulaceae bacterium]